VSPSSHSIASRVRSLGSRRLSQERYVRELIELADLEDQSAAADQVDRIALLRGRIAALENKVRELEAHK
jgi:polyhydroxyalkanoate synthesis regulator phasin